MISGIGSSQYSTYTSTSSPSSTQALRFQEALLSKLDTDEDGSISKEELGSALNSDSKDGITVSLSQAFSSLDSDEDDSLDAQELAALTPPPPAPPQPATDLADPLLTALDKDGDGSINSDELSTGLTQAGSSADNSQVFSALDTNEDGTVSLDELTASLQPQQPPAGLPPTQISSTDSAALLSALDADSSISASELSAALDQGNAGSRQPDTGMSAKALSKMIAALGERYDTQASQSVGSYLNTAA